ncbi:hypothetical protein LNJ08_06660 [Tenacibaculum finnmarkense genomovar ulcerans]|uniref:hypothetical protein n=1 Tax=Tenacibaculum finnmarkense TaxID=2781243 RepID=UPI001E5FBF79|nr:hypothetical protein [Tenacibaculum finnmarkense]MCD8454072.1 hypothetical protein [Tenacibaculum finnmarkense genomovar ulcerans]
MKNCWICGELADSEEHKFKASDLKRNYGKKFKAYYIEDEITPIDTFKHKKVKFDKIICEYCNVKRTRKHDDAYDIFTKYSELNFEKLLNEKVIDFKNVYGDSWKEQKRNLYRYYAKHAGCKIIENEYNENLSSLASFIKGKNECDDFVIKFELKIFFFYFHKAINSSRKSKKYVHLLNGKTAYFGRDIKNLNYCGWTTYNWITANWVYSKEVSNHKKIDYDKQKENIDILDFLDFDTNPIDKMSTHELIINSEYGNRNSLEKRVEYFRLIIE